MLKLLAELLPELHVNSIRCYYYQVLLFDFTIFLHDAVDTLNNK